MLRTAEFVPYVVFIEAPDFDTLRAMNRAALESGVSTKQLTVSTSGCSVGTLMAPEARPKLVSGRGPLSTSVS